MTPIKPTECAYCHSTEIIVTRWEHRNTPFFGVRCKKCFLEYGVYDDESLNGGLPKSLGKMTTEEKRKEIKESLLDLIQKVMDTKNSCCKFARG